MVVPAPCQEHDGKAVIHHQDQGPQLPHDRTLTPSLVAVRGGVVIQRHACCATGCISDGLYPLNRRRPGEIDTTRGIRLAARVSSSRISNRPEKFTGS